jgi:hypothetical protein
MPGNYRDSVVDLISEAISSVINNDHIAKVAIGENPQVFNVNSVHIDAVVPEEPLMNQFSSRVEVVKDDISVALMRSSEYEDLEVLVDFLQTLLRERTNVDASVDDFSIGKSHG